MDCPVGSTVASVSCALTALIPSTNTSTRLNRMEALRIVHFSCFVYVLVVPADYLALVGRLTEKTPLDKRAVEGPVVGLKRSEVDVAVTTPTIVTQMGMFLQE